jgi:hypothetical protein
MNPMPPIKQLLFESMRSGTIAAIAMMPFGFAFRALGLRVGHYGPKFAALFVNDPGPAFQFAQHIVLGWLSAAPLVLLLCFRRIALSPVVAGSVYGVVYYVAVNSLALPLYFGDELPWQKGMATVIPSLVIHVVFGACVGYFSGHLHRPQMTKIHGL